MDPEPAQPLGTRFTRPGLKAHENYHGVALAPWPWTNADQLNELSRMYRRLFWFWGALRVLQYSQLASCQSGSITIGPDRT